MRKLEQKVITSIICPTLPASAGFSDNWMALRLDGLSVTNPKGLNDDLSSWSLLLDSLFSEELALIMILFTPLYELVLDALLLLQEYFVVEEIARFSVGEYIVENSIVAKERGSMVQKWNKTKHNRT